MSNSVDDKVIKVSLDDGQFRKSVDAVIKALSDLKKSLDIAGSTKGLEDLSSAANKVKFNGAIDSAGDLQKSVSKATNSATKDLADLGSNAQKSINTIGTTADKASDQVVNASSQANAAIGKIGTNTSGIEQAADGIQNISKAAQNVDVSPVQKACSSINSGLSSVGETASSVFGKLGNNVDTSKITGAITSAQSAVDNFSTSNMASQIDTVAVKFSAFQGIALGAMTAIGNKAVELGQNAMQSMVAGAKGGLSEYEMQLDSVQTILANTSRYGTTVGQVNDALNELNTYADKTIYSFSDMTKNIGLFTNAGLKVEDATSMIKGFSNAAAASGANAQATAGAAYQLSQALTTGEIRLMDWRSITNAGMGGKNMQDDIINIANAMGTLSKTGLSTTEVQQGFNDSLQKGWLTTDVMSNYLKIMSGDMDDAGMSALGLSREQIDGLKKTAATAQDAATKTKSFSQMMGQYSEAIGSGWSTTWQLVFGDFEEAKNNWTGLNDMLQNMASNSANARNDILKVWHDKGGQKELFGTLNDGLKVLDTALSSVKKGFAEVFPKKDFGSTLYDMTVALHKFVHGLLLSEDAQKRVTSVAKVFAYILKGLLTVLGVAFKVVQVFAKAIGFLVGIVFKGVSAIVNWIVAFKQYIVETGIAQKVTDLWKQTFGNLISAVKAGVDGFKKFFGIMSSGFGKGIKDYPNLMKILGDALLGVSEAAAKAGERFQDAVQRKMAPAMDLARKAASKIQSAMEAIKPVLDWLGGKIKLVGSEIKRFFGDLNGDITLNNILGMFNSAFAATLLINLNKLVKGFIKGGKELSSNTISDGIKSVLGAITDSFKDFQKSMSVGRLVAIAGAIALLTYSLIQLSSVEPKKIAIGLSGLAGVFTTLIGSMLTLASFGAKVNKLGVKAFNFDVLNQMALATVAMGGAIYLIAKAAVLLKDVDPVQLTIIFGLIDSLMLSMSASFAIIGKIKPATLTALSVALKGIGTSFVLMASSLVILAFAIAKIAMVDPARLGPAMLAIAAGLGSMVAALTAMALVSKGTGADFEGISKSIVAMAASLVLMSFAISMLAKLDNGQLARGLIGVAAGLILISGAMAAIGLIQGYGGGWEKSAAAIISMAFALNLMVIPIKSLGKMDIASLAKGVGGVAVALAAMAGAMALMGKFGGGEKGLIGISAAILSFAAALTLLMIPIKAFAKMDWNSLAKGLGAFLIVTAAMVIAMNNMPTKDISKAAVGMIAFAGAMIVMSVAMKILGSMDLNTILRAMVGIAGIILSLQTAVLILGPVSEGLLLVAGAVALFGLGLLAAGVGMMAFSAGIVALSGATSAAGGIITGAIDALIMAIPALFQSLVNALDGVLKVLAAALPSLLKSLTSILRQVTAWMVQQVPMLAEAALTMIDEVLKKIAAHAPSITDSLVVILVAALNAVAQHAPEITAALGNVMNAIFTALGNAIRDADPGKFAAMLISMGVMALIFKSMAKMKKDVVGALLVGGTILLLMTGLVGVFALMNALNVKDALPNALAMSAVFIAMTLVFDIMAAMKSSVPGALIVGGSILLLLAGLSLVFGLMSAMHVTDVLPTALGMSAIMLAMSAVIVILGAIPISMGLTAIANMAIFIAGLAAVVTAAGAIAQIPGVKWLVSEGASFLASLGKALGGFVGSIVGGALEGVSNSLPTVATNLSTFMTNLGPFIDGAKRIDQSVLDSAGRLSQIIFILSASNLMNAITGWITGSSDFSKLSTNLVQFGSAMVKFADTTSDLDVNAVTKATVAGQMLTSLQKSIPASGGLLQAFTGDKNWSSLSTGLVTLGKALTNYGNAVANLNSTAITASIPAIMFLTRVQSALQNTDGIFQAFTGTKDWDSLGKNLGKLGSALVDYGEWASMMSIDAILASVPAVKAVIGLQNSLGNSGGVAGWLFGDQDLGSFAKNLGQLGAGLYDYYQNVVNVGFDAVVSSVSAVKKLVGMLQSLSGDYSGVGAFKTAIESAGDLGLASFAAKVSAASTAAGSAVKGLGTKLTDGNTAVASGVSALQATMASASFSSAIGSSLSAASQAVYAGTASIKNGLNGLNDFISGFGGRIGSSFSSFSPAVSSAMTSANSAIQGGSSMIKASLGSLSSFVSSYGGTFRSSFNPIIASARSGMDAVRNAINSYRGPFQSAANHSAGGVKEGMKSGVGNLSGIFDTAIKNSVSAVRQYRSSFEDAGKYIAEGLANGISDGSSSAVNAAAKMGADAVAAAKEASGVNSPSKLTYAIGDFVTQGLANGIDDNSKKAVRSSRNMGASVISALNTTMDKLALDPNYLSPKITPVIDTSNISSGLSSAFSATRSVGIRSKLDIGGIDYQDHKAIEEARYRAAMDQNNAALVANMSDLRGDMSKYTNALENQELAMYVDGRKLASSQAKYNNQELGKISRRGVIR